MTLPHFQYLYQYIEHWADIDSEFPTIHFEGRVYRAGELRDSINALATAMLQDGVRKGDVVMTILGSVPEFVISYIAANRIGAIVAPMDVRYRAADYARLVPHIAPRLVISPRAVGEFDLAAILAQHAPDALWWTTDSTDKSTSLASAIQQTSIDQSALDQHARDLEFDDGALIIFTGGTTGVPKAALLSHCNCTELMFYEAQILQRALAANGVHGRTKTYAALPPSHVGGTLEVIGSALVAGWELFMNASWSPTQML
jgi:acyl-CoA synthetase (AMP-forming)/AMP-acid ligase II